MAKIGVLVGSLRKESFSKKIADNVIDLFDEAHAVHVVEIGHLPFYNQDFDDENNVPTEIEAFRNDMKTYDGFIFVTPEYNRTVPAVLKNALDIGSRPKPENVWNHKPAGIISQSPGLLGGFGANHHLRQSLTALNMPIVQQPEVYLSNSATLLDEHNKITNEGTIDFLQSFVNTFLQLIK